MAVNYEQVFQTADTSRMPSTAAATVTYGFNASAGPIEYLMMVGDMTFADSPTTASVFELINSCRIVVNGEVRVDFRAGFNKVGSLSATPDCFSTLINKIGGRAYEDPAGTTTRKFYAAIPLGIGTTGKNDNTRFEIVMGYAATNGAAITSGTLEYWLQYNNNFQDGCVVASPTSFVHSENSIQTVVVKIPTNISGAVIAGIYVQADEEADDYGTQGIRCVELGSYGLIPEFVRFLNGTLGGDMIQFAGALTSTDAQTFISDLQGVQFLPLFGLSNAGEVTLIVDTGSITTGSTRTVTYTPILTLPSASTQRQVSRQTQPAIGNTADSIVSRTLD